MRRRAYLFGFDHPGGQRDPQDAPPRLMERLVNFRALAKAGRPLFEAVRPSERRLTAAAVAEDTR